MKKITLTLDARLIAWARRYAARKDQSLSQLVDELLHSKMREYDNATRRFLSKMPVRLNEFGTDYPSREELDARSGIR